MKYIWLSRNKPKPSRKSGRPRKAYGASALLLSDGQWKDLSDLPLNKLSKYQRELVKRIRLERKGGRKPTAKAIKALIVTTIKILHAGGETLTQPDGSTILHYGTAFTKTTEILKGYPGCNKAATVCRIWNTYHKIF